MKWDDSSVVFLGTRNKTRIALMGLGKRAVDQLSGTTVQSLLLPTRKFSPSYLTAIVKPISIH